MYCIGGDCVVVGEDGSVGCCDYECGGDVCYCGLGDVGVYCLVEGLWVDDVD